MNQPKSESCVAGDTREKDQTPSTQYKNHKWEEDLILAEQYEYGIEVERDDRNAVRLYRKAAKQGSVAAQFRLALKYFYGLGGVQNMSEALYWYHRAAEGGHVAAQFVLGVNYEHGFEVKMDKKKAISWYQKAVENGDDDARGRLEALQQQVEPDQVEVKKSGGLRELLGRCFHAAAEPAPHRISTPACS